MKSLTKTSLLNNSLKIVKEVKKNINYLKLGKQGIKIRISIKYRNYNTANINSVAKITATKYSLELHSKFEQA